MPAKVIDIEGQVFSRLTALSESMREGKKWMFRCECGEEKLILKQSVVSGVVKSCGCYQRDMLKQKRPYRVKHGESCASANGESPEYRSWVSMKNRCNNKNDKSYHRYGARGIRVCKRWDESYENFLSDMGRRPSEAHSLDRIDNMKGYSPDNCRWATPVEQSNNRRSNRIITHCGESKTLAQWSKETGINSYTIKARIDYYGWSVARALTP